MKRIIIPLLVCGMCMGAFAQTILVADQYEPNNSRDQAKQIAPGFVFTPSEVPPGMKRNFQANFHNAADISDWFIVDLNNPELNNIYGTGAYGLGDYPYMMGIEVTLSGMLSGATYSLSIHNGNPSISDPPLPLSMSGNQNVSIKVKFISNNLGSGEVLFIEVRRVGEAIINEGYTLTLQFYRIMPDPPTITAISPTSGPVGTTVTITGNNLGLGPITFLSIAEDEHYGYTTRSLVTSSSPTSVTTIVPASAATGPITQITNYGGGNAGSQIFTVTKKDLPLRGQSRSSGSETAKWVITPVTDMKGVLGKLDMTFPAGVDWDINISFQEGNKFITGFYPMNKIKSYNIAPGEYIVALSIVPVEHVPILKGHVTRIKAGFLNIVSEGGWNLDDETKKITFTSSSKPVKIAVPVGSYQLKLGGNYYPVVIKDGETVEY